MDVSLSDGVCSICKVGTVTAEGDCRNGECVCSARLLEGNEVVSGSFEVDGTFTARFADGSFGGQMRVSFDPEWEKRVLAVVKTGQEATSDG